tara:strand:+ start:2688 stop:3269 length:582 start_codon:yes stop_codon:yes gene_type:complete
MKMTSLQGGFVDAPKQSSQAFRKIMNVLARPGLIQQLDEAHPPAPLSQAAGMVLITLCDSQTPVYLADNLDIIEVREWITFHTNAPIVSAQDCVFAFGTWACLTPLDQYAIGTSEYPDRSATLVVEVDQLEASQFELSGPGIQSTKQLWLPELDAFQTNAKLFPQGLDFFFTSGDQIAALPRTTKIKPLEENA